MADLHENMRTEHKNTMSFVTAFFKEVRGASCSDVAPWILLAAASIEMVFLSAGAYPSAIRTSCCTLVPVSPCCALLCMREHRPGWFMHVSSRAVAYLQVLSQCAHDSKSRCHA